jgi:hypothetical protein
MTNLDIDRRLALAIGYRPEHVSTIFDCIKVWHGGEWITFNHQHAHTIYPIAEHFKMMPRWAASGWLAGQGYATVRHTDPRTCIALAVIEAAERGLLK